MKKLFYSVFVFFICVTVPLTLADAAVEHKEAQVPYTWAKGTLYALDKLQENVIVQLPVLKLKAENLAEIYSTGGHFLACFIDPEHMKSREQMIFLPEISRYKAKESEREKTQSISRYHRYGLIDPPNIYWRNICFDYPFIVYGNTALILLSSIPLKLWTLKPPHEGDSSFKVETCALQSLRKGEILISYTSQTKINQYNNRQLALFNCKTGNLTDIAKIDSGAPPDLLNILWLNDKHIAFNFRGRKIANWTIYEIPSGEKKGEGDSMDTQEAEGLISRFYVGNGCLFTKKDGKVLQLWKDASKEKRRD